MSSIINALLVVGLLFGGVVLFQNRCSILGLCGEGLFGTASAASAAPAPTTTGDTITNIYDTDGDGNTEPQNDNIAGNDAVEATVGCCHCKFVGDRVKCEVNGDGSWFNPPAGSNGSNDQNVGWSAQDCYASKCKGTTTSTTPQKSTTAKTGSQGNPGSEKKGVQNKNNSVVGSGQKINPPKTTSSGKPNPYASYVNANPGGYKPGGGTYFAHQQAYFNSIRRNNMMSLSLNGYRLSSF